MHRPKRPAHALHPTGAPYFSNYLLGTCSLPSGIKLERFLTSSYVPITDRHRGALPLPRSPLQRTRLFLFPGPPTPAHPSLPLPCPLLLHPRAKQRLALQQRIQLAQHLQHRRHQLEPRVLVPADRLRPRRGDEAPEAASQNERGEERRDANQVAAYLSRDMPCVGPEAMVGRLRGGEAVTGSGRVGQRGWGRNGRGGGEERRSAQIKAGQVERKEGEMRGCAGRGGEVARKGGETVNSGRREWKAKKQETALTPARTAAKRPHAKLAEDLVTSGDGNVERHGPPGTRREGCSPTQYMSTSTRSGAACVLLATPSPYLPMASDMPRDTKQPRPRSVRAQRLSSRSSSLLSPMRHTAHPPPGPAIAVAHADIRRKHRDLTRDTPALRDAGQRTLARPTP
ncbi:hypothetical protein DFH08DRAFT_988587 [Mycena albidolilacea]|uniref:Uncharacterized protein n=1 Tax=Mycena albidolilacea TaxID=1033008 RepID=A0AAD6Z1M9_9AGAR|nr:hypothetical protein DFH08DRAFT_988587 [Mycena albidolilacea]